jgi:hypothetical protein
MQQVICNPLEALVRGTNRSMHFSLLVLGFWLKEVGGGTGA